MFHFRNPWLAAGRYGLWALKQVSWLNAVIYKHHIKTPEVLKEAWDFTCCMWFVKSGSRAVCSFSWAVICLLWGNAGAVIRGSYGIGYIQSHSVLVCGKTGPVLIVTFFRAIEFQNYFLYLYLTCHGSTCICLRLCCIRWFKRTIKFLFALCCSSEFLASALS